MYFVIFLFIHGLNTRIVIQTKRCTYLFVCTLLFVDLVESVKYITELVQLHVLKSARSASLCGLSLTKQTEPRWSFFSLVTIVYSSNLRPPFERPQGWTFYLLSDSCQERNKVWKIIRFKISGYKCAKMFMNVYLQVFTSSHKLRGLQTGLSSKNVDF